MGDGLDWRAGSVEALHSDRPPKRMFKPKSSVSFGGVELSEP